MTELPAPTCSVCGMPTCDCHSHGSHASAETRPASGSKTKTGVRHARLEERGEALCPLCGMRHAHDAAWATALRCAWGTWARDMGRDLRAGDKLPVTRASVRAFAAWYESHDLAADHVLAESVALPPVPEPVPEPVPPVRADGARLGRVAARAVLKRVAAS